MVETNPVELTLLRFTISAFFLGFALLNSLFEINKFSFLLLSLKPSKKFASKSFFLFLSILNPLVKGFSTLVVSSKFFLIFLLSVFLGGSPLPIKHMVDPNLIVSPFLKKKVIFPSASEVISIAAFDVSNSAIGIPTLTREPSSTSQFVSMYSSSLLISFSSVISVI